MDRKRLGAAGSEFDTGAAIKKALPDYGAALTRSRIMSTGAQQRPRSMSYEFILSPAMAGELQWISAPLRR